MPGTNAVQGRQVCTAQYRHNTGTIRITAHAFIIQYARGMLYNKMDFIIYPLQYVIRTDQSTEVTELRELVY